jgi:hypothetical protein
MHDGLVRPATVTGVSPNKPKTPLVALRMAPEMKARILAVAKVEMVDFSEWMRRAALERLARVEDRDT